MTFITVSFEVKVEVTEVKARSFFFDPFKFVFLLLGEFLNGGETDFVRKRN